MQIVIDIPEEKYQGIVNIAEEILDASTFCSPRYLYKAVLNGTPLPKGHGRLIDISEYENYFNTAITYDDGDHIHFIYTNMISTIIEADTVESEDEE